MSDADSEQNSKRKPALLILGLALLLIGAIIGWRWYSIGQFHATTDNAYVGGYVIAITPRSEGAVVAIHADEMSPVQQGQVLVSLGDASAKANLAQAKAELADAVRQAVKLSAQAEQLKALITLRDRELILARDIEKRRQALAAQHLGPEEDAQHAHLSAEVAAANLEVAKRDLATTEALLQHTPLDKQPTVLRAEAQLRAAYLDWSYTQIPAPVSGYIAKRSVQLGQTVKVGETLMALVPLEQVWVDANFKEDQLTYLHIGQPVTLTADLYGNAVEFHGKVEGIAIGTGSAFALLPAQNASGNWIKVVQRVPVRIALDPSELAQHPLRIGLSMRVDVDTHDRSGPVLSSSNALAAVTTPVYNPPEQAVEKMIDEIVRANSTRPKE